MQQRPDEQIQPPSHAEVAITPLALTPRQAAAYANVSRTTIFRSLRVDLPAIRVGKKTLIDVRDLKSWLDSHKSHPGEA